MTPERPTDESLRTLLDAACSGTLTDDQFEHLEAALSASEEARREYLRYFTLTGELRYLVCMSHADAAAYERTGMEYAAGVHLADKPRIPSQETSSGVPFPVGIFQGMANGLSWEWIRAYLIAAVALGLFLLAASFIYVTHTVPADRPRQLAEETPARPKMVFVGRITGMVDVKWSDDPHYLPPLGFGAVPLGRKYILDSGLMEITYDSGAKVILQGPCTYEVESTAGGYLALGKLTAKVVSGQWPVASAKPQAANHKSAIINHNSPSPLSPLHSPLFSVRTPTVIVTDLGTEFGVEVDESGASAAHVFRGDVEVRVVAAEGKEGQTIRLRENESVRIETSPSGLGRTVLRGTADPTSFSSVRPGQLAQVARQRRLAPLRRWQVFSEELRKRDDLVAYYDFQRDGDNCALLPNRAATGRRFDGQVQGGDWVQGRFSGTSALRFGMPGSGVRLNIPVEFEQLTLAVWVNLDSLPTHAEYTSGLLTSDGWNEGNRSKNCTGRIHWQIHHDGKMLFAQDNWKVNAISPSVFDNAEARGHWRCLAVVYVYDPEASRVAFYLDGEHVGAADITADAHPTMAAKFGPATIGAWHTAQAGGSQRWVHGVIDEMMIFRSALDAEEIHRMYESTKP